MYGIYLKCEKCGATIGGEDVTPKQQGIPTLGRFEGHRLRELAAERGWAHVPPNEDLCPGCSKTANAKSEGAEPLLAQVGSTDGLGVAVPPAPTIDEEIGNG